MSHSTIPIEPVLTLTLTQDFRAIRCFPWEQHCLVLKGFMTFFQWPTEAAERARNNRQQPFHQQKWQTEFPRLGKLPFQFEWTAEFVKCLWLVRWTDTEWVGPVAACHWISSLSLPSLWYTFPCNLSPFMWSCLNTNSTSHVFPNWFWDA